MCVFGEPWKDLESFKMCGKPMNSKHVQTTFKALNALEEPWGAMESLGESEPWTALENLGELWGALESLGEPWVPW